MSIIELHQNAYRIKKTCALQRNIFRHWLSHNCDPVYECLAWDTETTGLEFHMPSLLKFGNLIIEVQNPFPFGISLCIPYKDELALFWCRVGTELYDEALALLSCAGPKVAHNARYDIRVMKYSNLYIAPQVDDTLLMSRICWDRRMEHSLQKLSEFICPELSDWEVGLKAIMKNIRSANTRARKKRGLPKDVNSVNYSFIPDEIMSNYSMTDAFMCWVVNLRLRPLVRGLDRVTYERERPLFDRVTRTEERGMLYDRRMAREQAHKLNRKQAQIGKSIQALAGKVFNPLSPKQLLPVLLDCGMTEKDLTTEGKLTTEQKTLEWYLRRNKRKHSIPARLVQNVLHLRSIHTLTSRYFEPLLKRANNNHGIIYYTIQPADTRTGRMAGKNPNMQFVPRPTSGYEGGNHVRACFRCRAGYYMYFFDWSVMELIAFGCIANSTNILKWFKAGLDLHVKMGKRIFGNRDVSAGNLVGTREVTKHVSYAYIFGGGIPGLMRDFAMEVDEAADCLKKYKEAFPEFEDYRDECKSRLRQYGYITDLFGKHYRLHASQAYKSVNAVVQGTCAHALKDAYVAIDDDIAFFEGGRHPAYILLPLHDELILERRITSKVLEDSFVASCVEIMEEIKPFMERGLRLRVDVKRTKTNWEEKETYQCAS